MSFSYASNVITQTGTDTDLTGLVGLTGVNTLTSNGRSFYQLDNKQLVINGTLDIDPELEELLFVNYGNIKTLRINTGTLNVGQEINVGAAVNRFSSGTWVRFARSRDSAFSENSSDLIVESGGTLNWYGGSAFSQRIFAVYGALNTYSKNCQWINQSTATTQIRQHSTSCNIDGLVSRGSFLTLINNAAQIKNWEPYDTADGNQVVSVSSSTPSNIWLTLEGLDARGIVAQVLAFWSQKWGRLIDCFNGSDTIAQGNSDSNTNNTGLYEFRQKLTLSFADIAGSSLDGVKFYLSDTDNGNRLAASQIRSNPSYTADRTYTGTSASGAITFDTDGGILVATAWRTTGGLRSENNNYDYRSESGTNADDFTGYAIDYNKSINQIDLTLKGSEGQTRSIVMLPDSLITESNKATVDAYTELQSPENFYDRAKSDLTDNYLGEIETTVNRTGNTIDARALNVVIDATAVAAFDLTGSTLTIKATQFIGNITTTGTFTLSNGATLVGTVASSNTNFTTISVEFTNLTDATIEFFDNTGNSVDRATGQTGTYIYNTPSTATGTWTYVINRIGYVPKRESFSPGGINISVDGALAQLLRAGGSVMYTGTNSANIAVTFDFVTPCMCIEIGDAQVDAQTVFDMAEQSLITVDGMRWQNTYGTLTRYDDLPGVGRILFLQDNIRLKRALAGDVNAGVTGYVLSTQGIPVDGANGSVAIVAGFAASDVWDVATRTLTGTEDVNVISIDGDTTSALNLKNMYNGTGYLDDAGPAFQAQVSNIAINAATATDVTNSQTAIQSDISALNDLSALEVNAEVDTALTNYDAPTKVELDAAQNSIESRQNTINVGVQKASKFIPHSNDL